MAIGIRTKPTKSKTANNAASLVARCLRSDCLVGLVTATAIVAYLRNEVKAGGKVALWLVV